MKPNIPTTQCPDDPRAYYFRCGYNTVFYGPFHSEKSLTDAVSALDGWDPGWDYNKPARFIYGAHPLPKDFVTGQFRPVPEDMIQRIESRRRARSLS